MKHRQHRLSSLIQASFATSAVAFTGAAFAQDTAPPAAPASSASGVAADLSKVTVTGFRASLQRALDVKRNANAIVDAISAEDIGKFPDTNAAESLSHLPGISVDRQFGEGEKVSINGTDPALNRVLVNGQTIATGQWGGDPTDKTGRSFNYTLLSPEIIGLMEVYKSPEARIDEGSIGGTVIVHTRRPLDLPNNTVRGSLGYQYNDRSKDGDPRGSILGSWKTADNTLGVIASYTHDKERLSRAGIEFFGYTTGAGIGKWTTGTAPNTVSHFTPPTVTGSGDYTTANIPVGINSSYFQQTRQRDGFQGAVQWKADEHNEFNLTGVYVKGKYDNFSESRYACPGCGDLDKVTAVGLTNGLITSGTVTAGAGNGNQPYAQFDTNFRQTEIKTDSLNLQHDFTYDTWKLTTQIGTTRASGGTNPEYENKFLLLSGGYKFNYDGSRTGVTYDNGTASNWGLAKGQQSGGLSFDTNSDKEKYLQFDLAKEVDWGVVHKAMVGVKVLNHNNSDVTFGNEIYATQNINLTQFSPGTTPGGLYDGLNASSDLVNWPTANLGAVKSYLLNQFNVPGGTDAITFRSGNFFNVKELTRDLYTQFDYDEGPVRGNFGVRYARTTDDASYYLNSGLINKSTTYGKFLPSFNIAYDLDPSKVIRGSVAKVIARPRYSDLSAATSVDPLTHTGSGGNPDLKPYESTNVDLAGEWYFMPASLLGVELFYRDIKNYVVSTTGDQTLPDPGNSNQPGVFSITSPINARNAQVRGLSLLYQQALPYGFGLDTNWTYTNPHTSVDLNLPYSSKHTVNVTPYFESGPYSVRLVYSWRSEYFNQIGRLNSKVFADEYKELDLNLSYQATKNVAVVASASNLLDSTYYWYNNVKYAPIGEYKNGRVFRLGLNFKL